MLGFGLNQATMAHAPIGEFVDVAARLGMVGIELRNDLSRPVFDNLPASRVALMLRDQGLRLLGLSQAYPFNRWSDDMAAEIRSLIDMATEVGAETISLIPYNEGNGFDEANRRDDLTRALESSLPLLEAGDMVALVEPLGFTRSSLRDKAELVTVIDTLDARDRFRLVHDTFHHKLAGGGPIFADQTGIVHISGVVALDIPVTLMEDEHRVLIDTYDRLGNLDQIQELRAAGYRGVYSFECFSPEVQGLASPEQAIRTSMKFISSHVQDMAA